MPGAGPISDGTLPGEGNQNPEMAGFFGWLNGMLAHGSTTTMDWATTMQLAQSLAAAGWTTKTTGDHTITFTAPKPDGRSFTIIGTPGSFNKVTLPPLIRPNIGGGFVETAITAAMPTSPTFTPAPSPVSFAGATVTSPAAPSTNKTERAQDQIVAELQALRKEIAKVKQPLIGELKQTVNGHQPTDAEIAAAAIRASALIGR